MKVINFFLFFLFSGQEIKYISRSQLKKHMKEIYNVSDKEKLTLEHVVPQSSYKETKKINLDMHNIIMIPSKLNIHRSNYKFHNDFTLCRKSKLLDWDGELIKDKLIDIDYTNKISMKDSEKQIFVPRENLRGEIARSISYFIYKYPEYRTIVFDNVIDIYTLLTWYYKYPVTDFEIYKSEIIEKIQGNRNPFVGNELNLKEYIMKEMNIEISHDYF